MLNKCVECRDFKRQHFGVIVCTLLLPGFEVVELLGQTSHRLAGGSPLSK